MHSCFKFPQYLVMDHDSGLRYEGGWRVDVVDCVSSVGVCCISGSAASSLKPLHTLVAHYCVLLFQMFVVMISILNVNGLPARSLKLCGKYVAAASCRKWWWLAFDAQLLEFYSQKAYLRYNLSICFPN